MKISEHTLRRSRVALLLVLPVILVALLVQSLPLLSTWPEHALDLEFSPDTSSLIRETSRGLILYDVASGREVWVRDHESIALTFSPDSRMLALLGVDGSVKLLQRGNGREMAALPACDDRVAVGDTPKSMAFSPNGRMLAVAGRKVVLLWDVPARRLHATLTHDHAVHAIAFSPDGATLATGNSSREEGVPSLLTLWDTASGEARKRFTVPPRTYVSWLTFVQGGELLASPNDLANVDFWDVREGTVVRSITAGYGPCVGSPDGDLLAAVHNGIPRLHRVAGGSEILAMQGFPDARIYDDVNNTLWAMAFSPDQTRLLGAYVNGQAVAWDVTTGQVLHSVTGLKPPTIRLPTVTLSLTALWIGLWVLATEAIHRGAEPADSGPRPGARSGHYITFAVATAVVAELLKVALFRGVDVPAFGVTRMLWPLAFFFASLIGIVARLIRTRPVANKRFAASAIVIVTALMLLNLVLGLFMLAGAAIAAAG